MSYDEQLADRIRGLIGEDPRLTEQKMFGGLSFLIAGHLAVTASRRGGAMIRVDPEQSDDLVAQTAATVVVMRGRPMPGWLYLSPADLRSDDELGPWIDRGIEYARSLPPRD